MNNKIAVYGSLRKGEYNYAGFGGDNVFKHLGTYELTGYKLFSLGSYPGIKTSKNEDDKITVDLLEAKEDVIFAINRMEVGAGYYMKDIKIGGNNATLYVYDGRVSENNEVKSGDWTKRKEM